MFWKKRHIFIMLNRKSSVGGVAHLHDIKTKRDRRRRQRPQVGRGRPPQHRFFLRVDGVIACDSRRGRTGFYFDENQHLAVARYHIEFLAPILRIPPILRHDFKLTLALQESRGRHLTAHTRVGNRARATK